MIINRGLTSDSKLVIISDLHKTTDKYSVTPPANLTESYYQIFKLKNHDDNSFKIGLLKNLLMEQMEKLHIVIMMVQISMM